MDSWLRSSKASQSSHYNNRVCSVPSREEQALESFHLERNGINMLIEKIPADTEKPEEIIDLHVHQICADDNVQSRFKLSQATVLEYVHLLQEDHKFPPVVVFHDGTNFWLAEGFHRLAAHKQLEREAIPAKVIRGGKREAMLHSISSNSKHGLQPNDLDKRKAVEMLLADPEWSQWSDRAIAEKCGTTGKTVGRMRKRVAASADCPHIESKIRKYKRNGKEYVQAVPPVSIAPVACDPHYLALLAQVESLHIKMRADKSGRVSVTLQALAEAKEGIARYLACLANAQPEEKVS